VKTGKALVAKSREAQHPQKRKAGPVAKPTPKTAEEAHRAILHQRASVVKDRRGNGYPFWRLYLEGGSGQHRRRRRAYVGSQGGPELRKAIRQARRAFWGAYRDARGFQKAMREQLEQEGRQLRQAAGSARAAGLAQIGRHPHGRTVRACRSIPAVERYRSEYRTASRRLLEAATWQGITLTEYIALRRVADRGTSPKLTAE